LIALVVAVVTFVLALVDILGADEVNGATLLILAVLAAAVLRDRSRTEAMEDVLEDLPEGLRKSTRDALDEMSMVRVLRGSEVGRALEEARQNTDRWFFKGGTGTYIRAVTLPTCIERARERRRTLRMRLEIIDPTNEDVCEQYARFRQSGVNRLDATGEPWTLDRTRKESFATILAACLHKQHYQFLELEIGLSARMTTFRWDLSDSRIVITQEDPGAPAMMIERGKPYYDAWSTELQASFDQASRVPLEQVRQSRLSAEPTVEEVRKLFVNLSIPLPHGFTDRAVSDIIRKALQPTNPYK
jgi:hypothetical protein